MQLLIIVTTVILIIVGLAGTLIPFLPGSPLILAGALLYAWHPGFTKIGWGTLLLLLTLTILSEVFDRISSLIGAKRHGASHWGLAGAFLGGVVGLIFGGIAGLIIGPLVGVIFLEMIHGRNFRRAFYAGWGALLGILGGVLGKFLIALLMIGILVIRLLR